ncbi:putative zinc finger motif, C2HC5-type [Lyophyllum shimeji]|uniref:Zinc finger motif, C2HC5-type n=1 Tax=Lyophyllum shimeji TaxID=47721 RepID=A0A9P3PXX0_LYOSH|nr:putative zinc finger motif, C2HC5-type [Lyophyllum shimeji]
MHHTPWTKKTGHLTSDRLRPKPAPNPARSKNAKTPEPEPPQSKALRTLHALRSSLRDPSTSTTPDPTGGCFCQARTHPLSPYVPICTSCALPLCNLASPAHPCPSCSEPLLTPARRTALLARIEAEIADTELKEQLARERAEEARRAAAGAFPALAESSAAHATYPSLPHSQSPVPASAPQVKTHKVLSLNSKTKKAVLTTTTTTTTTTTGKTSATSTPAGSRPASPQPVREPRPGLDQGNGKGKAKARVAADRPWQNLSAGGGKYVPPVRVGDEGEVVAEGKGGAGKRRRGRGKGKGKEKEGATEGEGKENVGVGQSGSGGGDGGWEGAGS